MRLAGSNAPLEWQLTQAKAALWNEPVNPYYRDFYAATLIAMGKTEEGLKEVARSVAESPSLSTHAYLSPENLPALNEDEQTAVEQGFKQALSNSYPEALTGLAEFYLKHERFADQAALYEQAAGKEMDKSKKVEILIKSGLAYPQAAECEGQEGRGEEQGAGEHGARQQRAKRKGQRGGIWVSGVGLTRTQKSEARDQRSDVSTEQSAKGKAQSATLNAVDAKNANNASNAQRNNATNAERETQNLTPNTASAIRLFRAAAAINPSDPKPYQQLIGVAFAAESDAAEPRKLIEKAIENGAPPLPLICRWRKQRIRPVTRTNRRLRLRQLKPRPIG